MSELEQYKQELSEIESFIPLSSGSNYILLLDRKEQLNGRISELIYMNGEENDESDQRDSSGDDTSTEEIE